MFRRNLFSGRQFAFVRSVSGFAEFKTALNMETLKHIHESGGPWHDGSLADCPETVWDEVMTTDGKPARLARGMSVQEAPEGPNRFRRFIDTTSIG
jgi:hypothetical protein